MTRPRELRPGLFLVGAIDWDRRLFDDLIPLPDGTSYNSYLLRGEEYTALIDTVDPKMADVLVGNLRELGVEKLDYVVINHAEQDHSGSLPRVLELYPDAVVVCSPRCRDLLVDHLHIPEDRFMIVKDGEALSLGEWTLKFLHTPWVHWPETMCTYLEEEKILFSCDFFGSHLATSETFADPLAIYEPAKRYYAEIMMPFRPTIRRNLEKIERLGLEMIAPSHGPLYDDPSFIMEAYRDWASEEVKNVVVIPYTSMHGSTEKMVSYLMDALMDRNIGVKRFDLTRTDVGKLAMSLVDAATMVIGTCTVLTGPHPNVANATFLANALRPKLKFVSIIGSYGWGGRTVKVIQDMIPNLKVEMIDPVLVKGLPRDDDFRALDELADEILERHKELKILEH
ncbi:MAG: FprA family A-type flavoprotein [Euryarchaeota archaeon]|nr:FprA family A-type flavoprotein [Euryarchaeota archaeon]